MKKIERLNDYLEEQINILPFPIRALFILTWAISTLAFFVVSPVLLFHGKYLFGFLTAIQPIHFSISLVCFTVEECHDRYNSIGIEYNFDRSINGDYIRFNGTYYHLSEISKSAISLLHEPKFLYVFSDVVHHSSNEPDNVRGYDLYIGYYKIYLIKIQRVCGVGFFGNKYDIDIEIPFLNHEEANKFMEVILNK